MDFTPETIERMRNQSRAIREKMDKGDRSWSPHWDLVGKNAIVQPGGSVIVRFMPRWDYPDRFIRNGDKLEPNPEYQQREVYVATAEHWYDTPDGKRMRDWCRKASLNEPCPGCETVVYLGKSPNKDDRDSAKNMRAQDVYVFNAVVDDPRRLNDEGLVDIRWIGVPNSIAQVLLDYMSGGDTPEKQKFRRGDITDIREGYDVVLTRPRAQGDRWKVDASKPSPLYSSAQGIVFKGWPMRLINLPELLEKETKGYDEFYENLHGMKPADHAKSKGGMPPSAASSAVDPAVDFDTDAMGDAPNGADIGDGMDTEASGTAPEDVGVDVSDFEMPQSKSPAQPSRPSSGRPTRGRGTRR